MLKRNLIANFLGQGWTALMGLAFIPIYIKFLGIESYGLIGVFAVLQAWLALLDLGLTPTLSRELARFTAGAYSVTAIRDLLRSVEVIAVGVALLMWLGVWTASGWLASEWLQADTLPQEMVAHAFVLMGALIALRFVEGIYRSAIIGLQKQVLYNVVNGTLATLRGLGAVCILIWWSPTIEAFFLWQGVVSVLSLLILAKATYRALPNMERSGQFSVQVLRGIGEYAGGIMGLSVLGTLLTQVDKVLLSKLLSLSNYGYYALATVISGALFALASPIPLAWSPRLSQLHAASDESELIAKFHLGAQLVTVFLGSGALVMMMFSPIILQLWTRDANLAYRSSHLLTLLALGNGLNGFMWIPYSTQLAYGWTRLAVITNVIAVLVIVPAILWVTPRYGAEGAAWVWVSLNAGYVIITMHFMFRRILTREKWRWYGQDLIQPLFAATVVSSFAAWVMPPIIGTVWQLLWLLITSVLTLLAASLAAPAVRATILARFNFRTVVTTR